MYSLGIGIFGFAVNFIMPHQGRREGKGQRSYQGEDEEVALRRGERKEPRDGRWPRDAPEGNQHHGQPPKGAGVGEWG